MYKHALAVAYLNTAPVVLDTVLEIKLVWKCITPAGARWRVPPESTSRNANGMHLHAQVPTRVRCREPGLGGHMHRGTATPRRPEEGHLEAAMAASDARTSAGVQLQKLSSSCRPAGLPGHRALSSSASSTASSSALSSWCSPITHTSST